MMRLLGIIFLALAVSGCAQQKFNYTPKYENLSHPPVGEVTTAHIGERMLIQGLRIDTEAVHVKNTDTFGLAYTVTPGTFLKHGEDERRIYYHAHAGEGAGIVTSAALADPFSGVMVDKKSNEFCIVSVYGTYSCSDDTEFELVEIPVIRSDNMQQTLIYSGRVGNKINVVYREFQGDTIRQAFTNAVEYDLSESDVIGYKGARIKVIEATNQQITYEVISNFN